MSRVVNIDFDRLQRAIANGDYDDFKNEIDPKLMLFITLQIGGAPAFTELMKGFTTEAGQSLLDLAFDKYFSLEGISDHKAAAGKIIKQLHECFSVPYKALSSDQNHQLEALLNPTTATPAATASRAPTPAAALADVGIAGRYTRRTGVHLPAESAKFKVTP